MYNQFNQGQNFGAYPQGGMQYNQMPVAKMTQTLSPEQIKQLRTTSPQFSLQVEPIEFTRSICTHKDQGKIALIDNNDGTVTCSVCGARFKLTDAEPASIQEITSMFIDVLQSIKTYYLDIPENYVTEYFKMIPLLEKVPKFFELALANFKKYENGNPFQQQGSNYGFNMFNAIAGPGAMGMGGMNPMGMNPMGMNQGMAMGQGVNQPMYQPNMGYQQSPFVNNGFDMNAAQQQAQPAVATPTLPTEATAAPAVQSTKMFNL